MNYEEEIHNITSALRNHHQRLKVLEGVQGPERHLVGDVAERIPRQDGVEETESGRRGVGEIVGALELRKYIASQLEKSRERMRHYNKKGAIATTVFYEGQVAAMIGLREWLTSRTAKRSDLSNDTGHGPRERNDHE